MLEYLPGTFREILNKRYAIDPTTRQAYTLPSRKYPYNRIAEKVVNALSLRRQDLPLPPPRDNMTFTSLWTVRVLCTDGLEYGLNGKIIGSGLQHLAEYLD